MKRVWFALWLFLVAASSCSSEPAVTRQMHKIRLIEAIRQALLEGVAAEKSAVLATTDEESKSMAGEAEQSAAAINQRRAELRALIVADGRQVEMEKLDAFDAAWAEVERVDQRLLALAIANTNLKAARLSANEGATQLNLLVDTLSRLGQGTSAETLQTLSSASIAALRIQTLLLVHIPSADDAEMTRLEERMSALSDEVNRDLAALRERDQVPADQLAIAVQAWTSYQSVLKDVLRLSRENTNVISFDVSVHEKRAVTKHCLETLSALEDAVNVGPKGVR